MKTVLIRLIAFLVMLETTLAGHPIFLPEAEACSGADLVVIATLDPPKDLPLDPFGSDWNRYGFTLFSHGTIAKVLLGNPPKSLLVYGGKLAGMTEFRLESGKYLLLLKKVEDDVYRAVDALYSFMPVKDGKVKWLKDRLTRKTEWITIEEAKRRIAAHKAKSQQSDPGKNDKSIKGEDPESANGAPSSQPGATPQKPSPKNP